MILNCQVILVLITTVNLDIVEPKEIVVELLFLLKTLLKTVFLLLKIILKQLYGYNYVKHFSIMRMTYIYVVCIYRAMNRLRQILLTRIYFKFYKMTVIILNH